MVVTLSKRAKRLVRSLSESQDYDEFLAASVIPLIRYTLLHSPRRCVQVSVELERSMKLKPNAILFHNLPNFLRSQLVAQNITDNDSLWDQVKPLLHFIQNHFRTIDLLRGFPTLFRWYCQERHRSFFFFAFVDFKMSSRPYSARELLHLRHAPLRLDVARKLYEKLRSDPDLNEIIRIPSDRSLFLIMEEEKPILAEPDNEMASNHASASQLDGTEAEWKYRGRTDSEHAEGQPISAPSGPAAQKNEGFQRFYKAVVSPTHVRVTAGGRIVPNTRGSSSPTGKWNKERTPVDGAPGSRPQSGGQLEPVPYPLVQGQFSNFAPMMPGYGQMMAPRMVPGANPYQFIPTPVGYNMNGSYAMPPAAFNQFQTPRPVHDHPNSPSNFDKQAESGAPENPNTVQLSPPEQFDLSRPFFYNGQWTLPPGHSYYPYGMVPSNGYPAMTVNGTMAAPYGNAFNPTGHQVHQKLAQPVQPRVSQPPPTPATLPTSSATPPISSIRLSEITKKQIDTLRGNLRYLEDQLQYNRHQIDEKGVEHQSQLVRQQIQQFEKNFEKQLVFEETHYPTAEKPKEVTTSASTASQSGAHSRTSPTSEGESDLPVPKEPLPRVEKAQSSTIQSKPRLKASSRPILGLDSSKSVSAFATSTIAELPRENTERLRKVSSLPTHAALAPPFQPRKEVQTSTESAAGSSIASGYDTEYPSATESAVPTKSSEWKTFFKNFHPSIGFGAPYLIGELPRGIRTEAARDTDYMYNRELTEDELRARHMYWGKTPRHLQKGLPKFDGKDFYPPSPVKGQSTDVSSYSDNPGHGIPMGNSGIDYGMRAPNADNGPFQSMVESGQAVLRNLLGDATQSESLPRVDQSMIDDASDIPRPESCVSQVSPSYEGFRQALEEKTKALSDSSNSKESSDEGEDNKDILFRGRQAMTRPVEKLQSGVWQNMMRKGKSSVIAVPVKVSPMTAQGVLPNYAGHATASLTPAIANTVSSRSSSTKFGETNETGSIKTASEKRGENRRPGVNVGGSLQSSNQDSGHRSFVSR
ncbi:Fc.00g029100.m01.CDS01 [Cosmosporella sp. VM-42]